MTLGSMKARYRGTFAGFLWVIINPLLMYFIQSIVFKTFLKIDVDHFFLFLLSGLTPWMFLVTTVSMATPILLEKRNILVSFKTSPFNIILSCVLDNLINFIAVFLILFVILSYYFSSIIDIVGLLLLPLATLVLFIGVTILSFLTSFAQVFYRDTRFIVQFFISILFFMTPIFYPVEFIPSSWRWIALVNPVYIIIKPFRSCLYDYSWPVFIHEISMASLLVLILCLISWLQWRLKKNEFYLVI